jgi:hypothetical protein
MYSGIKTYSAKNETMKYVDPSDRGLNMHDSLHAKKLMHRFPDAYV